ncbi:hypothetical protein [Micromonospora sp. RTGN7]|uniref:hypothetical protein n=1 Tax=Micromonospora sp. RTGN7 TaxID=3016526 RepID=UPI0029FF4C94|nr:hypothetical protein [Micromonospora sp. RTGN7]
MSEPARKIAQHAEERLDHVAKSAREKFNTITESRFTDKIRKGRFADQSDHGGDQGRTERDARQGERGGPPA